MKVMEQIEVPTAAGYALDATEFAPVDPNGQAVLISAATGVRQQFYYNFAAFLARNGFYAYTYNYYGIGLSDVSQIKSSPATYRGWATNDYPAMVAFLREKHAGEKLHLIGHSFGGNCLGLSEIAREFSSIMTVATQDGYWRHFPKYRRWEIRFLFRVLMPLATRLFGYFPGRKLGYGEDIPPGVAREWEQVMLSEKGFLALTDEATDFYPNINHKMLIVSIEDDWQACRNAVDVLAQKVFVNARISRRHITLAEAGAKAIGHLDFFRKKFEPTLWQIPLEWLRAN